MHLLRRHTHANMQANSKGLNTHIHTHTAFAYQVISTVRLGPYQRLMAGRVKSTLASAAQCAVCYWLIPSIVCVLSLKLTF